MSNEPELTPALAAELFGGKGNDDEPKAEQPRSDAEPSELPDHNAFLGEVFKQDKRQEYARLVERMHHAKDEEA